MLIFGMKRWFPHTQSVIQHDNDYLNDRLSAQRILAFMSLTIPLGLFLLYLITPNASDSGSTLILINISAAVIIVAAFRFFWNWNKPKGDTYQLSCALLDFLSAAAILIAYALSYEVPISIALKSPTANIFFIYLTSRIVLFSGKIVVQTGVMAIGTWIALVLLSIYEPQYVGRTSSYIEYLTSFKVLLGAEIERLFQFGIITAILYSYIYFARHDATTGFLRRAYFLQSILKFLSQDKSKYSGNSYALIEVRAIDNSDLDSIYNSLFKTIPKTPSFSRLRFIRMGRLSPQSAAAWIEYSGRSPENLNSILKDLHKELSEMSTLVLGSKTPSFVIGGAKLNPKLKSQNQLSRTDIAIREALKETKKFLSYDTHLEAQIRFRRSVEKAIRQGLEENLLSVAYQPIIDLMTDIPTGFESLIRLKTETGEIIPPDVFIPIAEETGLIDDITDYLCNSIASEAVGIRNLFSGREIKPYINVNISPVQLKNVARVTSALKRASLGGLVVNAEITESTILNEHTTDEQIHALKTAGFAIAIDDFGTGYSSIERLKNLESMTLKIDQSFVCDIEDPKAYAFLGAIVNLAQTTSNLVIVEGVETLQQKLLLMKMGVRYCQGFYYGKPMKAADLGDFLETRFGFTKSRQKRAGHIASF